MNNNHEIRFRLLAYLKPFTERATPSIKNATWASHIAISFLVFCMLLTAPVQGGSNELQNGITIKLDSLTGPNGYRLEGRDAGHQAGRSLSPAGDINGDGLDDFIIGAPSASHDGIQKVGEAYVVFGGISNPASLSLNALNATNGFRLSGGTFNDETGYAVSGAGDVNGDGFDDVIVGAPGTDPTDDLAEAGAAYVVFGRSSFPINVDLGSLNGANGFRVNGMTNDDRAGSSVGTAGDVNGDGFEDLLIGAANASPGGKDQAGQVNVVYGRASYPPIIELSGLNGSDGFQINGISAEGNLGKTVNSAGDFNGDGYGDLLLTAGTYLANRSLDSGIVYVVFGRPAFSATFNLNEINGTNGVQIEGIGTGDNAGRSAVSAGDVNGDGRDDLIIGAPYAAARKGEAYVVFGRNSYSKVIELNDLDGKNGFRLVGNDANGEAGTAVGGADVNGDGLDDVIVGASVAGTGSSRFAGKVYVVLGNASFNSTVALGAPETDGLLLLGASAGDQAGQTISKAGDTNGDGFDEFLIGAPNASPGFNSDIGYVYLVQGGATLGLALPVTHPGTPNNDNLAGTKGADIMHGGRGNDQVNAADGQDTLKGGAGDDVLTGGPGDDRLIGGNGMDTASYTGSVEGVSINLFTGVASGGDAGGDLLRSIEGLVGSPVNDTLVGNTSDNILEGRAGDNSLTGGLGDDAFRYGPESGNDTIIDFMPGPGSDDYLDFTPYTSIMGINDLNIAPLGTSTVITLPNGAKITLLNVAPSTLHADDYRFYGAPFARPDIFNTPVNGELLVPAPGVLENDENPTVKPLTATVLTSPANGTLTLQTNGSFTYKPNKDFVGGDEFSYQADNGQLSNVARVTIDVTLSPPVAVDDAFIIQLGETLTVPAPGILANDQSAGGPPLVATLLEEPVDGTLVFNTDGSFLYTPSVDYSSQDRFTYRASNGLLSNVATVVITVLDPNGPPVASDDDYEISAGNTLSIAAPGVLGNDINPLPGVMTAIDVSNPANGVLNMKADGSFTYTPNEGYSGVDSFTYQASNGELSNLATVTITITGENETDYRLLLPSILRN